MKLISIGRFTQSLDYKSNIQNYTTWNAMSQYFDAIYLVVESPNAENHFEKIDKLFIFWLPCKGSGVGGRIAFMRNAYHLTKKLICESNIDVIDISEPVVAGPVAVRLKKELHKPLVTQIQGQLLDLPAGAFSRLKTRYICQTTKYVCRHSDRIRTVSGEITQSILKIGIPKDQVFTVPPRCDVDKFDPLKFLSTRTQLRATLGYREDDTVIVFTGRVVAYRDLDSDLLAMKSLVRENRFFRLLVVGDGQDRDRLEAMCEQLGLQENVQFIGRVPFDDVPKYLSVGDIFVSTPTNEGIARSVLEAMSMQLPVVATRVGGTPEVIENGINGILVDVKSPEQIADGVRYISQSAKKRTEMGQKAREVILDRHEFHKLIKQFAEIHFGIGKG